MLALLEKRGWDDWGSGEFGSSRGSRVHKGIDYTCAPQTLIAAPVDGFVTKLGYPYAEDLSYRYVEITDSQGHKHRVFYILPTVAVGLKVFKGSLIGTAQDVASRYTQPNKIMKNHIHYEILNTTGTPVDPEEF